MRKVIGGLLLGILLLKSGLAAATALSLSQAEDLISEGKLLQAKETYRELFKQAEDKKKKAKIRAALEKLNMKILFSKTETPDSFLYEVKSGDSLYKIAKQHKTTIELLQKANGLKKDVIYPGMKLKVMKAKFSIQVDRSANILELRAKDEVLKTYSVATGEKNSTPLGTFEIVEKLIDPVWYKENKAYKPDDPQNILGTRWLGFDKKSYGIHGTTLPETIGTQSSSGCVRMLNKEVEELFAIVPLKTKVTVVE